MIKKKNLEFVYAVFLVSFLIIAFAVRVVSASDLPKSVAIATHPKGASLNAMGSGLAKVISTHTPISAVDRPYTGYITWVPLVNRGSVDMGIGGNADLFYAYRAISPYKEKNRNLRLISSGTQFFTGPIVRADSGIKKVADLKGKRATIDPTTMSTKRNPMAVFKAGGLDPDKDITVIPVAGVVAGIDALIEGRADVAWASVGMGKAKEAAAKLGGLYWLSVCDSANDSRAQFIRKNLPGVDVGFIKKGTTPEVKNDFWFLMSPINLVTHKNLNEEAAYLITKAIWENHDELKTIHPLLKRWVKGMVSKQAVVPYHPGAIRFYKEAGAWTDDMTKIQQRLLSE